MTKEAYLQRLGQDPSLELFYGIPLETIPYQLEKTWELDLDEWDIAEETEHAAQREVERLKDEGRPGAFLVKRLKYVGKDNAVDFLDLWAPQL